jgi:hypothetical protein
LRSADFGKRAAQPKTISALKIGLIFLLLFLSRKKVSNEGIKKYEKLVHINDVLNLIPGSPLPQSPKMKTPA